DFAIEPASGRIYAVREDHRDEGEAINTIVRLDLNREDDPGQIVAAGHDFFAAPRLSPDGKKLAWLSWDHPNMPWDGTELWLADLQDDGSLGDVSKIAGGVDEAIVQPKFSPDGMLYFISDRSGWWNLYRYKSEHVAPICPMEAEFGAPAWGFGQSTYGFLSPEQLLAGYYKDGRWSLVRIDAESGGSKAVPFPFISLSGLAVHDGQAFMRAGSIDAQAAIIRLDLESGAIETLKSAGDVPVSSDLISIPESLAFPTESGATAYAFYYPPNNPGFEAPEGRRPPLIVKSHGGPTGNTSSQLNLATQFWTSRGFAVCDVDYGGSTGYGRAYRERLNGRWGEVDVLDCINAARYLADAGKADPDCLAITGGSAGGFTTLAALAFHDVFKAGASHFGVSDLEALAKETHKFESRYLDRLIGPYPARADLYQARSPIHHVDGLDSPMIFFQGPEDVIVPPNQAEMMVEALRKKGIPVVYLTFEGEQHGFRKAETIQQVRRAELAFYGRVFGFEPADGFGDLVLT
ncbi:MAG: S9 family peptidase, partial [Geminicoccaceae bacterium]